MRTWSLLLVAAAAALITAAAAAGAAPPPELWQKAVALAAESEKWVPGTLVSRTEELDNKGQVEHVQEATQRVRPGAGGDFDSELVRVVEDGKDVTAEARADEERRRAKAKERAQEEPKGEEPEGEEHTVGFGQGSPFDPDDQAAIVVKPDVREETIGGRRHLAFTFSLPAMDDEPALAGTAWIDAETGAPGRVCFTPDPLPPHMKRMDTTLEYAVAADGGLRLARMTLEGTASFLLIKKHFRLSVAASDHFRAPEKTESPPAAPVAPGSLPPAAPAPPA